MATTRVEEGLELVTMGKRTISEFWRPAVPAARKLPYNGPPLLSWGAPLCPALLLVAEVALQQEVGSQVRSAVHHAEHYAHITASPLRSWHVQVV